MNPFFSSNSVIKLLLPIVMVNLFLAFIKMATGLWVDSGALFADGLNSLTDFLISVVMMGAILISRSEADHNHHYGHEKYEGIGYFVLGLFFILTAFLLIRGEVIELLNPTLNGNLIDGERIGLSTGIVVISLLTKIGLVVYISKLSSVIQSAMVEADLRNHIIDLVATTLALFAIVLRPIGILWFDSLSAILIAMFIFYLGVTVLIDSVAYLTDKAPEESEILEVASIINRHQSVLRIDELRIRQHMNRRFVDVEISVDSSLSLKEAHAIAEDIHLWVEEEVPTVIHCMVHVNPYKP